MDECDARDHVVISVTVNAWFTLATIDATSMKFGLPKIRRDVVSRSIHVLPNLVG
jgi:hypothetical protein